jgi:DNA repair photolyase
MIPPIVHEIESRSAINSVQGMPFKWSLNPYKGCGHACAYCYARAYHAYLDLPPSTFETQLFVKTNIATVLRRELRKPTWRGDSIAIGTGTDPYQPLEGQYRLTRRCLEELLEVENPGSITTKGTLVVRDADLIGELARRTDFSVHISLISLDADLIARLEPGAPPPKSRLRAVERLSAAGIPVSVFLAPVLPGLTDQPDQIADVVRAAAESGARDAWASTLRLGPGVKEHFMDRLAEEFPSLVNGYNRMYGAVMGAPIGYQLQIQKELDTARRNTTLGNRRDEPLPESEREPALAGRRGGQLVLPI